MQQQVWLDQTTTLNQKVEAVTQDALQLTPLVILPVSAGGDTNIYTSSGSFTVSPSPGPISGTTTTSSSSSTTTSSSSSSTTTSGTPGSADYVIWLASYDIGPKDIVDNGISWMDTNCVSEATSRGWVNADEAVAAVANPSNGCHRGKVGGSKVFTPMGAGFENITGQPAQNIQNFFAFRNGSYGIREVNGSLNVSAKVLTGCNNDGSNAVNDENCGLWTTDAGTEFAKFAHSTAAPNWLTGTGSTLCSNTQSPNMRSYCLMRWASSSSGTSTSTTSSSSGGGGPAAGDPIIWIQSYGAFDPTKGISWFDGKCVNGATQINGGLPKGAQALALLGLSGQNCYRGLTGGTDVWTPKAGGGYEKVYAGPIQDLYSNDHLYRVNMYNGNNGGGWTLRLMTGCSYPGGTNSSSNCQDWTSSSGDFIRGAPWLTSSMNFQSFGTASCTPGPQVGYYCYAPY